jgi:hypothetical protein
VAARPPHPASQAIIWTANRDGAIIVAPGYPYPSLSRVWKIRGKYISLSQGGVCGVQWAEEAQTRRLVGEQGGKVTGENVVPGALCCRRRCMRLPPGITGHSMLGSA